MENAPFEGTEEVLSLCASLLSAVDNAL